MRDISAHMTTQIAAKPKLPKEDQLSHWASTNGGSSQTQLNRYLSSALCWVKGMP
jgi:hypothetical protein